MTRKELKTEIEAEIAAQTNRLLVWIVSMVAGGVLSIIGFAIAWGVVLNKVQTLEAAYKPADYYYEQFVSRTELVEILRSRDKSVEELKTSMLRIETKIDNLSK